jgi:ribonuclease Z
MQRFELLILGSGSALPTNSRNPSAQLLNVAERFFLIDCGEGTQLQLRKFKASFGRIDAVFISHLHGDHFFGLIGLLQTFHLLGRKNALRVYGPPPLKEVIEMLNKVSETHLQYPLEFHATQSNAPELIFEDNKVEVFSFPLKHKLDCTGFLFREKPFPRNIIPEKLKELGVSFSEIHRLKEGLDVVAENGQTISARELTRLGPTPRSYAYCSDTQYHEEIVPVVQNVTLMYHESTFLEEMRDRANKTMHSTAIDAATIALKANAGQLILGHFSARYENQDLFLLEAQTIFKNCLLASDGKLFSI